MKMPREIVGEMKLSDLRQMTNEWSMFEVNGVIGDCLLRRTSQDYIDQFNSPSLSIVMIMQDFAFEAYRRLALGGVDTEV